MLTSSQVARGCFAPFVPLGLCLHVQLQRLAPDRPQAAALCAPSIKVSVCLLLDPGSSSLLDWCLRTLITRTPYDSHRYLVPFLPLQSLCLLIRSLSLSLRCHPHTVRGVRRAALGHTFYYQQHSVRSDPLVSLLCCDCVWSSNFKLSMWTDGKGRDPSRKGRDPQTLTCVDRHLLTLQQLRRRNPPAGPTQNTSYRASLTLYETL
jgi:hypothetical protein